MQFVFQTLLGIIAMLGLSQCVATYEPLAMIPTSIPFPSLDLDGKRVEPKEDAARIASLDLHPRKDALVGPSPATPAFERSRRNTGIATDRRRSA